MEGVDLQGLLCGQWETAVLRWVTRGSYSHSGHAGSVIQPRQSGCAAWRAGPTLLPLCPQQQGDLGSFNQDHLSNQVHCLPRLVSAYWPQSERRLLRPELISVSIVPTQSVILFIPWEPRVLQEWCKPIWLLSLNCWSVSWQTHVAGHLWVRGTSGLQ